MTTLLLCIVLIISTWLTVMMKLMIQLILIMKIISNACNNMLFCEYFASISMYILFIYVNWFTLLNCK